MFRATSGVVKTSVGYAGGTTKMPTYSSVCGGDGHTEVVLVEYDVSKLSFDSILQTFWDKGSHRGRGKRQYASVIFTTNAEQLDKARAFAKAHGVADTVTVEPLQEYWLAEDYHQQFYAKQRQ